MKSSGCVAVASTRSWSPSLSTSANSDCAVSSRTPTPASSVMSSNVAVAAVPVQPIGQAGRLRDVEILEAVAVRVADRHAVVPVRVARQHRVERRHPGVEGDGQLPAERLGAAERRLGDLGEDRRSRAADHVRRSRSTRTTCQPAALRRQRHLPLADVLDARAVRPGADDVVADRGAKARGRNHLPSSGWIDGDEELGDGDLAHVADQPLELARRRRARRASDRPGRSCALVTSSCDWLGAGSCGGEQPAAAKARIEQGPGDAGEARRTTSEGVGHVAQSRLELLCLTLERKRVGAGLDAARGTAPSCREPRARDDRSFAPARARLTRGVWRRGPATTIEPSAASKLATSSRQPHQTMRRGLPCRRAAHRATPVFGMLADSDSVEHVQAIGRQLLPLPAVALPAS